MVLRSKSGTPMCMFWVVLLSSAAFAQASFHERMQAVNVVVNNAEPRHDADGNILDAHDGALEYFDGRFYLYGTQYGDTDGLGNLNHYVCYSSPDLIRWRFEGFLLRDAPRHTYYRPYVKFNRRTEKYVLWYNADNRYGVAIADRPAGPFIIQNPDVAVKYSGQGVGDFGLFIDDDGNGFITYVALNLAQLRKVRTANPENHRISVESLAPDYLSSTQENSGFVAGNVESPTLFKRNGIYYLLFDNTCAFCTNGSGVRVYTASSALGPYVYKKNINLKAPLRKGTSWTVPGTGRKDAMVHAQQTDVAQIPTVSGTLFMWMGDRWGSTPDKIKGHDFQAWLPLAFDHGIIRPLRNLDRWSVTLSTPAEPSQTGERLGNDR